MKPIHLNLASKPWRDYRPVWLVVAVISVVTAILMVNNVITATRYFRSTEQTRAEIANIEAQIAREERQTETYTSQLKGFDTRRLNARASFINTQIAERTFSWSQLLDDLERVMPDDVRLVRLNPTIDDKGMTRLELECMARSSDGLIELLNSITGSAKFYGPILRSESVLDNGLYRFSMEVAYRPAPRGVVE